MNRSLFLLDVCGAFAPGQVILTWRDEPRPTTPELEALINQSWAAQLGESRRRGRVLFDGPLVRYLRHRVENGRLLIDVGPTDYREFIGSNFVNGARADEFGPERFSNPMGVSAAVLTCDGWIVLGRRNQRVACHPGFVHTFGGGIEAGERLPDGTFDAFETLARELHEELRIASHEIEQVTCLGMIRDPEIRQPELVFTARVKLTGGELAGRVDPDDPEQEHTEILGCKDEADALVPFIRGTALIAPITAGALLLHGRARLGEAWYSTSLSGLEP